MMGRGGMMGRWTQSGATGQYGPMHEYMVGAMAEALGMTDEELDAELAAGKTMWQVAEEKGLSTEEFQQLMIDARTSALEKMVADGVLTQEQADWMQSRMQGSGAAGRLPDAWWRCTVAVAGALLLRRRPLRLLPTVDLTSLKNTAPRRCEQGGELIFEGKVRG